MRRIEALILVGQSLLYGGPARTLQRLASHPQVFWAAAASIAGWLLASFKKRTSVDSSRYPAGVGEP